MGSTSSRSGPSRRRLHRGGARPKRQTIDIRSLWAVWTAGNRGGWGNQELMIAVQENTGAPLFLSPAKDHAPHTLIAGSTGSGKSVLMQNIILGIAATNTPEQAKIILIDPKQGVDYFAFEACRTSMAASIDDQLTATHRLEELVIEMDRRYADSKRRASPIWPPTTPRSHRRRPTARIWLIHDEFAEWMLTEDYKEAVSDHRSAAGRQSASRWHLSRLRRPTARRKRHADAATLKSRQSPHSTRRISEGTSEIALGEKGAERLLGKGHMLAKLEGERNLCFAQVPLVIAQFADEVVAATIQAPRAA